MRTKAVHLLVRLIESVAKSVNEILINPSNTVNRKKKRLGSNEQIMRKHY